MKTTRYDTKRIEAAIQRCRRPSRVVPVEAIERRIAELDEQLTQLPVLIGQRDELRALLESGDEQ